MRTSLDLEVTRRCNLRCDYCFVGWSRDWVSDMPESTAFEALREGEGLFEQLHVTGGEPFAWSPLFHLLEEACARYDDVLVNSNGTLLDAAAIQKLRDLGPRFNISISLDGPREVHDRARGAGRFAQTSETLRALLEQGIRVTVMTVVTPEVLRELASFLGFLRQEHGGLAGVTLFPVGVGHEGSQKPGTTLRPLSPAELRELALAAVLYTRTGFPVQIGAYPIVNPILRALGYPEALLYQCTAGRGRACIHADLTVSSCHPVKEAIYGNYHPGLLARLASFEAHERLRTRDFEGCGPCEHREECGHCRAFVTASGEPFFGNDQVCRDVLRETPKGGPPPRVRLPIFGASG